MASIDSLSFVLLSCLLCLVYGRVLGPEDSGNGDTASGPNGHAGRPGEVPEPPPFFGRFGMRCPMARTWEEYRMNCAEYIDENCGCVYDDMHIDRDMCLSGNRTEYERLVHQQEALERERDELRVRNGELSSGERYFQVLDCLHAIPKVEEETKEK